MVINNNLQAQKAASNLAANEARLNKSLTRLSSGMRITDATEDAAGLAVGMRLDAQLKRLSAARTNTANAISLTQMQDGYLSKIAKALDRMSELSMLAQDVIKSNADRNLYNGEFMQLASFIRDAANKSFNGVTLFSPSSLSVATDSEGNIFTMKGVDLGRSAYNSAFYPLTPSFTKGTFSIKGLNTTNSDNDVDVKVTIDENDSLDDILTKIQTGSRGFLTATYTNDQIQITSAVPTIASLTIGSTDDTSNFLSITQIKANGTATVGSVGSAAWSPSIRSENFATPVTPGYISFVDATNATVTIAINSSDTLQMVFEKLKALNPPIDASYDSASDKIRFNSTGPITLGSTNTSNFLEVAKLSNNGSTTMTSSDNISSYLTSPAAARATLDKVKTAIVQLAEDRAMIGANQTRLSYTMEQLEVHRENITAATSRIEDVNVADESTEFAKSNILVQAATAMLAQANQMPQSVLKLLQ